MNADNSRLFNNPASSDIKIRQVHGDSVSEYSAHKSVLCMNPEYFRNMLVGAFSEASTQTIDLYDDDPDHFGLLLKAMYTHRYDHTAVDKLAAGDKSRCIDIALGVYMLADKYDIALINRLLATQLHDILTTTKDENNVLLKATIAAYYKNPAANVDGEMGKMLASIVLGPRRAMRAINLCFLHRQVRRVCSKTVYVDRLCALEKVYLYVLYLVWQRYEHGELAGGRVVKPETIEGKCDSLEDKEVGRVTSR